MMLQADWRRISLVDSKRQAVMFSREEGLTKVVSFVPLRPDVVPAVVLSELACGGRAR